MEIFQQVFNVIAGLFGIEITTETIANEAQQVIDGVSMEAAALVSSTTAGVIGTSTVQEVIPAAQQILELF